VSNIDVGIVVLVTTSRVEIPFAVVNVDSVFCTRLVPRDVSDDEETVKERWETD
jgi:hypothetical protein